MIFVVLQLSFVRPYNKDNEAAVVRDRGDEMKTFFLGIVGLIILPLMTVTTANAHTKSETNAYEIKPYRTEPYRIERFRIVPPTESETSQATNRRSTMTNDQTRLTQARKQPVEKQSGGSDRVTVPTTAAPKTSSVPEPCTVLVLAAGIGGAVAVRRRFRQ